MPTNLELKARFSSPLNAQRIARGLHARRIGILKQRDVYYCVPKGRVKLRTVVSGKSELIVYRRADARSSRYSDYLVIPLSAPKTTNQLCTTLFGVLVEVRKTRLLYLYENARIHIDKVEGLGSFVEFEVIVQRGKQQARLLMKKLIEAFKISPDNILGVSYSDLLLKKKPR